MNEEAKTHQGGYRAKREKNATKSNHNPKQIQEPKYMAEYGQQKVADSGKVCDSDYFVMLQLRCTLSIVIHTTFRHFRLLPLSKNNMS